MTHDHLQDEGGDGGGDDLVRDSSMALMRVVPLLRESFVSCDICQLIGCTQDCFNKVRLELIAVPGNTSNEY